VSDYLIVDRVITHGRQANAQFKREMPRVSGIDRLVVVLQKPGRAIAVDVTERHDYGTFFEPYIKGEWIGAELYLVDPSQLDSCKEKRSSVWV
jgi:hypothetical protein